MGGHVAAAIHGSYAQVAARTCGAAALPVSSALTLLLLIVAIALVGAVVMCELAKWSRVYTTLHALSQSHAFVFASLAQAIRIAQLLPAESGVGLRGLTEVEQQYLAGNVTHMRALIAAAEAGHNSVFYGRGGGGGVSNAAFRAAVTCPSLLFRVYTGRGDDYRFVRASYLTHVHTILAAARSAAAARSTPPPPAAIFSHPSRWPPSRGMCWRQ